MGTKKFDEQIAESDDEVGNESFNLLKNNEKDESIDHNFMFFKN